MDPTLIVLLFGTALFVLGLCLMRWHVSSWRAQKHDLNLADEQRDHYYRRYRRRMQASGLIALLGVLLPVGVALPVLKQAPGLWSVYWVGVLLLSLWVILLGIGDFFSTVSHSRTALTEIRARQRALERQLSELRGRQSNGRRDQR